MKVKAPKWRTDWDADNGILYVYDRNYYGKKKYEYSTELVRGSVVVDHEKNGHAIAFELFVDRLGTKPSKDAFVHTDRVTPLLEKLKRQLKRR